MRKLFLASIGFSVGENDHTEQRLVYVDIPKGMPNDEQRHQAALVATDSFNRESNGTDRIWISTVVPPVLSEIEKTESDGPRMMVDVWYRITDIPPRKEMQMGGFYVHSANVVIDVNGRKECYAVGYYDFQRSKWTLDNINKVPYLTPDMKWRTI